MTPYILGSIGPIGFADGDLLGQRCSERTTMMNIRPLHDRVVIKRLEEERTTAGGIVIPDTATEKPVRGEIVAIGPGKMLDSGKLIPLSVKTGEKVLFGKYSGTEVKIGGEELVVMREDDIMGIIEE